MTTQYPHHVTMAVPELLLHGANSLALCLGEQPRDDETFVRLNHMIASGDNDYPVRVSVVSTLATQAFVDGLQGNFTIVAPQYRLDADVSAAQNAVDYLRWSGAAVPLRIAVRLEPQTPELLAQIGIVPFSWTPININTCEREWLLALDGISDIIADAIIGARPFTTLSDMARVVGVSQAMVDAWGWRITHMDGYQAPEPPSPFEIAALEAERKTMVVSRLQGRLTLGPVTVAALDAIADDPETPWAMRETIKNAGEWRRTSQAMDELGYVLAYEPIQMDALFRAAATVNI